MSYELKEIRKKATTKFTRTTPKPQFAISDWEWSDQEFKDFIKFMEGKTFSTYDYWSKSWYSDHYKVENGLAYKYERNIVVKKSNMFLKLKAIEGNIDLLRVGETLSV